MIRYTLKCSQDHAFESWFASAAAFDTLCGASQVSCPQCGSLEVSKTLMTPRVTTARKKAPSQTENDVLQDTPKTTTQSAIEDTTNGEPATSPDQNALSTPQSDAEKAIAKIRAEVEKNSDYVGTNFVEEARKMNDGDTPARAIYGEAKLEDAKALIEEGVPVVPLPFTPKRKVN